MRWTVGLAWLVLATAAPSAMGLADEHENAAGEKSENADAHPKEAGDGKAHEAKHEHDLFHHTRDNTYFELPEFLGGVTAELPAVWIGGYRFQITKLMVLQVVVGLLMLFVFGGLARRIRHGQPPRGAFWNFWEVIALFLRDNVVRPTIGTGHHDHGDEGHGGAHGHGHAAPAEGAHAHDGEETAGHPADKYLPYVWTVFFWVLFSNLLGAVPFLGSPTQHITVTGVLAACTFAMVLISGSRELGPVQFWVRLVPKMDVPAVMELPLFLLIWLIEILGLVVKHGVLAVRLFANILAGHTVIAVFLGFIAEAAAPSFPGGGALYWLVVPSSIFGQVAIGLLELMVAFIQAYIFAFLSTLFIATAVHPH